jgi:hypothetical protein
VEIDRVEAARALAKVLAYLKCGKKGDAEAWARVLMTEIGFAHLLTEGKS